MLPFQRQRYQKSYRKAFPSISLTNLSESRAYTEVYFYIFLIILLLAMVRGKMGKIFN